jgi:hypothetical protein
MPDPKPQHAEPLTVEQVSELHPCTCPCHYDVGYCDQCCDGSAALHATLDAERAKLAEMRAFAERAVAVVRLLKSDEGLGLASYGPPCSNPDECDDPDICELLGKVDALLAEADAKGIGGAK